MFDVIIVGGGVSAYGAAMYCGRFNMKTLIIQKIKGGTIILTDIVENYPGFKKLTGMELAKNIEEHALEYKTVSVEDGEVTKIEKQKDGTFKLRTLEGNNYATQTVIYATGTEWKKLGAPGEKEYMNRGVHYCALCDGTFYKNKVIGVVGGGDSATKEALLLTTLASKVYMIVRKDKLRAEPINLDRALANEKLEVIYETEVKEIKGNGKNVSSVLLSKQYKGKNELELSAVFVEIGHDAITKLAVDAGVAVDKSKEIIINRLSETNVPGFFAAGDCCDTAFKQAITGVAEGVTASYSANLYIEKLKHEAKKEKKK